MSAGIRSGVNWMRLCVIPSAPANACTMLVLPIPGTPSSSACPPRMRLIITPRIASRWPTIAALTWVSMAATAARNSFAAASAPAASSADSLTGGSLRGCSKSRSPDHTSGARAWQIARRAQAAADSTSHLSGACRQLSNPPSRAIASGATAPSSISIVRSSRSAASRSASRFA